MNRRRFLQQLSAFTASAAIAAKLRAAEQMLEAAATADWLPRWEKYLLDSTHDRFCDKEMGEELGWLVSPFLEAFAYGYLATRDTKWIERLIEWTDACLHRAIQEPDGFPGWPKGDGGGHESPDFDADSLLGEAMMLRPVVMLSAEILKTPALEKTWGAKARSYLEFSALIFKKWDSRDCWREVKGGGVWVVPAFGIDRKTHQWTPSYVDRKTTGFTHPDNKQNLIATWLIAMYDATKSAIYRDRAEKWWRTMKSRMHMQANGTYFVWNYWEPAGPWDYKPDGSTRHWVGVHPNGGYYGIDVEGIVTAFEHGLVFTKEDIACLVATNRDFMWNQEIRGARFQRIDHGPIDPHWKNTPGVLWTALLPYDGTLRKIFVSNFNPASWGGMVTTPWALNLSKA